MMDALGGPPASLLTFRYCVAGMHLIVSGWSLLNWRLRSLPPRKGGGAIPANSRQTRGLLDHLQRLAKPSYASYRAADG